MRNLIRLDSDELKAWHEVGHATVCLHLGGDLDRIEFLESGQSGFAVARGCYVTPESERSVSCGGFAAEYFLLRAGCVDAGDLNDPNVNAEISARLFSSAWQDQQDFCGRTVTEDNDFTKEENEAFMLYAIQRVAPIFDLYFERMQLVVDELLSARTIHGTRVRYLLQIATPR